MNRILIIEDEERIAGWIRTYMEREGHTTKVVHDGPSGLEAAGSYRPHLVILDLMLPGLDGMEVCRQLRRFSDVPVIMLTARGTKRDRISGLDGGADDYIVKPFDPDELAVRVKALLRRTRNQVRRILEYGPLSLDETAGKAFVKGRPLDLSRAQLSLLRVFLRHPDMVLSRSQLAEQAFGDDFDSGERSIDAHIKRLRKILKEKGVDVISTVYGMGYRLGTT